MADQISDNSQSSEQDQTGLFGRLVGGMNALGTVWIIGLMLLINSDIFARNALNAPIAGVSELVAFSIVGIVFLQLAHTLRTGSLTRSDVLLSYLERRFPRARHLLVALFHLAGASLMAIVASKLGPILWKAWEHPERHFMGNPGFFMIPQWPLFAIVLVGIVVTCLQFFTIAVDEIRQITRGDA